MPSGMRVDARRKERRRLMASDSLRPDPTQRDLILTISCMFRLARTMAAPCIYDCRTQIDRRVPYADNGR